jgi:hypothetical protein
MTAIMTKGEREDLQRLVRQRERALKSAAAQRSSEMLAEFEQQLASVYSWDQDEIWKQAVEVAKEAAEAAQAAITKRCQKLRIPARFAPQLGVTWVGRGENAVAARRAELTRVAKSRIAAIERGAITSIEMDSVKLLTEITANGLSSEAAKAFLDGMPSLEKLMPQLEVASVEKMIENRKGR